MSESCQFASPCLTPDYRTLSVEAPDGIFSSDFFFWGFNWGNPQQDPPLGSDWKNWTALGVDQSPTSQPDADDQAAVNQGNLVLAGGSPLGSSPVGGNDGSGGGAIINPSTGHAYVRYGSIPGFSGYSCAGVPYTFLITANGFKSPFSFNLSAGSLPPGLTLDPSGLLSGTPTAPGNYNFTVLVTDARLAQVSRGMTFEVLGISNASSLPDAILGSPYSVTLDTGGVPAEFFISAGSLPDGLSLDQYTGIICGIATGAGSGSFSVRTVDAYYNACVQTFSLLAKSPLDWGALQWGPFYSTCTPASPYIPPNGTFSGAAFSFAAGGGAGACNDPDSCSVAKCDGTLVYTGPAKACNLHLVANPVAADPGSAKAAVAIIQNGNSILSKLVKAGGGGTFDCPFTVADTGGNPNTIVVTVSWEGGTFSGWPGGVTGNGLLT